MSFADLHLHTRYSDGSWKPAELVREAQRLGFAAISITDHDTLDGIPEALDGAGIEVIPGVEITCRVDTWEVHMLAYLPGDSWKNANLHAVLDHSRQVREKRIHDIVARLNELSVPLTADEVFACSDCGTIGRPHVAMALHKRGVVKTVDEAFERFLKRGKPGFVERYRMTAAEAIGYVKRAGGIAALAHPGLNRIDDRIGDMVEQGMEGLEVWHSRHSPSQIEHYRQMAERLGLLMTGGSDCHGTVRGKALLGSVKLPYEYVEALKVLR
jgi:3',5'-nucleoside bisphosphate phosphatase